MIVIPKMGLLLGGGSQIGSETFNKMEGYGEEKCHRGGKDFNTYSLFSQ